MANRMFVQPRTLDKEVIIMTGRLIIGASGVVSSTVGSGFTAARTGAGVYRITFQDKFVQLMSIIPTLLEASASALVAKPTAYSLANKTVDIRITNGAVATDPASGNEVHFEVKYKNSSAR